jgi:hypothetical protein
MTGFLLAGTRRPEPGGSGELALGPAARGVVEAARWHGWLRRWGLLLSFALPCDPRAGIRACLVVAASDERAASRLAAGWATVTGYQVAVLTLTGEQAGKIKQ